MLIFESKISQEDINNNIPKDTFLQNVLTAWRKVYYKNKTLTVSKNIIWNNSDIKNNNKTIFYKIWFEKGIKFIESIYDYRIKKFYTFEHFSNLYNIPNNEFLKFNSLISAIPKYMKAKLENEQIDGGNNDTYKFIDKVRKSKHVNKLAYNCQLKQETDEHIIQKIRWEEEFPEKSFNWKNIYMLPIIATTSIKLRNFQYKYLMRIIATNKALLKFKMVSSNLCDFCSMDIESVNHLFWECPYAQRFWADVKSLLMHYNVNVTFDLFKITFGFQNKEYQNNTLLNFITINAKYFIYINKCRKGIPNCTAFKAYLFKGIEIEKEIALRNDTLEKHNYKWRFFQT